MKTIISKNIDINLFCKKPIQELKKTNDGAIAVFKNNTPVFYAITPDFLKKIFKNKTNVKNTKIKKDRILLTQKFSMHVAWMPDNDFIHQAALWGITLNETASSYELAYFISYWQAEGCFFHHIQWQQKLARSLQKTRSIQHFSKNKRDITYIPQPDRKTPHGFRGE